MNCREFEDVNAPYDIFWDQARVGSTYYNVLGLDSETVEATAWFVVLYLPIFPLRRVRLKKSAEGWAKVKNVKTQWSLVLSTYLKAYVLGALALFGPMVPFIKEVYKQTGFDPKWQIPGIVLWLLWFMVVVWKLADFHESSFQRATRGQKR